VLSHIIGGFWDPCPIFCQLIQTMESELSRTQVNRCEVWTNSIRYFSLLSKHVLDSCVMKGLNWEPQIVPFFGLVHHKGGGGESRLSMVPSLNLCITRELIWETQFAYLLAGHWIYGTIYVF
jgi:hypothetical protein